MKVVLFAGGLGTRLSEETEFKPKPMVEIGGKPILWHIIKHFTQFGHNDFIVCLGYKGYVIKEYFMNYFLHNSDFSIDLSTNKMELIGTRSEKFKVTLIDTGLETKTAGRLARIKEHLSPNESFLLTYGDGVSNVNLDDLTHFHLAHGKTATVTAIQPEGKFGGMELSEKADVINFKEKPQGDGRWINGGFFVLNYNVFDHLPDASDNIMWEENPLESLTKNNELVAFKHTGFWKCMDALRDKIELEELWKTEKAAWKTW